MSTTFSITGLNGIRSHGKRDRGHGRWDWVWDWIDKDRGQDVMLVTGRFGLKSYDLSNPAKPKFLDEITAEELRLPGDPPYSASNPTSTFWQNEDMDVDQKRKLALLSRDPRAYRGSVDRDPGQPDPNGATNIEEDFGPGADACKDRGKFTISSLKGSTNGEGWRSTPAQPFRLKPVGSWSPYEQEGSVYTLGSCSAHYFEVDGPLVTYAWYGQGTRFLDISKPENPIQVAYYRPDNGNVWASYLHKGYVYTADAGRGVDVLRFTRGAKAATASRKEVVAPKISSTQVKYLRGLAKSFQPDPAAGFICMLPA
jgi:hypothetical protein